MQVGGTIKASEGFVETSGKDFKILDNATIEAGKWLIDPTNLTVDSALASSTQSQLKNGDVELQADEDITVSSDITWSTDKKLTLTAGDEIYVNATIENTNNSNGGVYFKAANTKDKVIFGTNGKVIINNIYQLQWLNQALNGTYELGSNINAGVTSTWNSDGSDGYYGWDPIGDYNTRFGGTFDGNGYVIDALHVTRPNEDYVGLFGFMGTNGIVINIGLTNVNIIGKEYVGGLAGWNYHGNITNSYTTGSVDGSSYVGGLVGKNTDGTIKNSYATGSVNGLYFVGGLVGDNYDYGTIKNSYATVRVDGDTYVGGLVGINCKTIRYSYATGSVRGYYRIGGLVGKNDDGTTTKSYWDKQTSGQTNGGRRRR